MQAGAMHFEGSKPQMSEPSASQRVVAAAKVNQTERESEWGTLPPMERIAVLERRIAEWEHISEAERGDGRNAFDRIGPQAWQDGLTGADVFYLAARARAKSVQPSAIDTAAESLRTTPSLEERVFRNPGKRGRMPLERG
jgi:hypothetical protein